MVDLGNDGIRPQDYSEPVTAVITYAPNGKDCVETTKRKSKAGVEFTQYTLHVDLNGEKKALNYLMKSDLKLLRDSFGRDTTLWIGKSFTLSGVKDGEYYRWLTTTL